MSDRDDILRLIQAHIDRSTEEMRRVLEIEMFKTEPFYAALPQKRIRWYTRWRWALTHYFRHLGRALRGEDCACPEDYE